MGATRGMVGFGRPGLGSSQPEGTGLRPAPCRHTPPPTALSFLRASSPASGRLRMRNSPIQPPAVSVSSSGRAGREPLVRRHAWRACSTPRVLEHLAQLELSLDLGEPAGRGLVNVELEAFDP